MNLNTTYMGMPLKNPIVASASPLSENVDNVKRMQDAGAAAVVMFSLFEEQLTHEAEALEHFFEYGTESVSESLSYFPNPTQAFHVGPERYLDILHEASSQVDIPILGSLNGFTQEGWVDYAKQMEQAGAKGIELNVYYLPADMGLSGRAVEQRYLEVFQAVKAEVVVPVALKLSPFFSSIAHMAQQFDEAGADGLVLFNRFYQPDFDLDTLEVSPSLQLSTPAEICLPLRWIAILHGHTKASLAATTGVHSGAQVVKYLLAGADVVMTTSALLQHGIDHIGTLLDELSGWMASKEYESVEQLKGSMSQQNVPDPVAFERANYVKLLESYKNPFTA